MDGTVEFQFDDSKPLLPQIKDLIRHHRKLGFKLTQVNLLPENYLIILQEMKAARGFPLPPEQTVHIIGNIMNCKIDMAIPDHEKES